MDTDIYAKILKAQSDLNYHRLEVENFLIEEFPDGCRVYVKNRAGQSIPTAGTVVSHDQDEIGVQLHAISAISGTGIVKHYPWKELKKF